MHIEMHIYCEEWGKMGYEHLDISMGQNGLSKIIGKLFYHLTVHYREERGKMVQWDEPRVFNNF